MIRRLSLSHWRTYENLEIDFSAGTTFVVAPNGIGKTSLLEAASWAAFGEAARGHGSAIRVGAAEASATIDLELPDQRVLTITRVLAKTVAKSRAVAVLDGEELDASLIDELVRSAFAADLAFLGGLTMPTGDWLTRDPVDLDVRGHLCRFFGVDQLRVAAKDLEGQIKVQERLIKNVKEVIPRTAAALEVLESSAREAATTVGHATEAHTRAQDQFQVARDLDRHRVDLQAWSERLASYEEARSAVGRRAVESGDFVPGPGESLEQTFDRTATALRDLLETNRLSQARLSGQAASIRQHSSELELSHADCPVCRRPLDELTVETARQVNSLELDKIDRELLELVAQENLLVARSVKASELIRELRAVPSAGPEPARPEGSAVELELDANVDELAARVESALQTLVEARARERAATELLRSARADESAHQELLRLFQQDALLKAAHGAFSAATDEIVDQTIDPLAIEIRNRWGSIFSGRGTLTMSSSGEVTRKVGTEVLPWISFSTGERAVYLILIRLLALSIATRASFCWLDEPLEHLDPDARRMVASLLARVSSTGPLKQIVVTTYEEPLARKLHERDPDNVRLVYVRSATGSGA